MKTARRVLIEALTGLLFKLGLRGTKLDAVFSISLVIYYFTFTVKT